MRAKLKRISIGIGILFTALLAIVIVLAVDGEMYERWKGAEALELLYKVWVKEGRPEPSTWQPAKAEAWHGMYSMGGLRYASNGTNVASLFHYTDDHQKHRLFITADGSIFVIQNDTTVRPLWQHKTRAAAW